MDNIPATEAWRVKYASGYGYETPERVYLMEYALTGDRDVAESQAFEMVLARKLNELSR